MEQGRNYVKFTLVLGLFAAIIVTLYFKENIFSIMQSELIGLKSKIESAFLSILYNIIAAFALWIIGINLNAIGAFLRRSIIPTDNLIIGKWYVYRFTVTHGSPELISDEWQIRRNLSRRYVVDVQPIKAFRHNRKSVGELIYNERDRFSILYKGRQHKEQSLICFTPRIPLYDDSRILGLGVGDDADYVLSCRPYLACRERLDDDHAKEILVDAVDTIRSNTSTPLVQFPAHLMHDVLNRHPLPNAGVAQSNSSLRNAWPVTNWIRMLRPTQVTGRFWSHGTP